MNKRVILYADNGKVLTNGTDFGKIIYLAESVSEYTYYEITEEEYEKILEKQEKENNFSQNY